MPDRTWRPCPDSRKYVEGTTTNLGCVAAIVSKKTPIFSLLLKTTARRKAWDDDGSKMESGN
eukprot:CAMPEP_0197458138 /NCGR_PEP_ID=MMETSP1175-20131217/47867_1 /TAXON_ID=1003142 /ORGANISM="Triceratium dubium, Strain CCMP147" /LENGTH=61 /DNA_ID=CAMNT_0042992691 /DNA_START=88 /DNA_END=270 /DNA_ORIENTATION=+